MTSLSPPLITTTLLGSLTRRSLLCLLCSLGLIGVFLGTTLPDPARMSISDALPKDSFRQYFNQFTLPAPPSCPSSCASDPFSKPGMMYWHPKGLANETRWLPFAGLQAEWEMTAGTRIKDAVPRTDEIPVGAFEEAAPQYTARLHAGEGDKEDAEWDWLRNRTLILMGSRTILTMAVLSVLSHDRNNVDQFCRLVHGQYKTWGRHVGGFCKVPKLDLVVINFFLYGMVDEEDLNFPPPNSTTSDPPYTFENRLDNLLIPLAEKHGIARQPDLVLLSSLFWDEHFLTQYGVAHRDRQKARGYLWNEIAWHRSRLRELFTFVRRKYGQDIPMMFRTRHIRAKVGADRLLHVAQLDQSGRAASRDMGVRLFTWGEKLEGYVQYSDNDQHFNLGPNTFLFGDMALFYLRQATVPGCWAC